MITVFTPHRGNVCTTCGLERLPVPDEILCVIGGHGKSNLIGTERERVIAEFERFGQQILDMAERLRRGS